MRIRILNKNRKRRKTIDLPVDNLNDIIGDVLGRDDKGNVLDGQEVRFITMYGREIDDLFAVNKAIKKNKIVCPICGEFNNITIETYRIEGRSHDLEKDGTISYEDNGNYWYERSIGPIVICNDCNQYFGTKETKNSDKVMFNPNDTLDVHKILEATKKHIPTDSMSHLDGDELLQYYAMIKNCGMEDFEEDYEGEIGLITDYEPFDELFKVEFDDDWGEFYREELIIIPF
ncbi:MAG: hypothetical protein ACOCRO_02305 [Halanaerobiales bacterium]